MLYYVYVQDPPDNHDVNQEYHYHNNQIFDYTYFHFFYVISVGSVYDLDNKHHWFSYDRDLYYVYNNQDSSSHCHTDVFNLY